MKIGIITIHNSPSYGGSLQSYALYRYLELQGYNVEIIDLHRPYQRDYQVSRVYKVYSEKSLFQSLLLSLKKSVKGILEKRTATESLYSEKAFEKFQSFNGMIKYSEPYLGCDMLYRNPPIYDVYITGSDQVWNPYQPYCIEPYFLTFVPKGKKRVSYAASVGLDKLPIVFEDKVSKWLKNYNYISVREQKTANYLSALTGLNIATVADPTFLLTPEYWNKIAVRPKSKNYILMFTLGTNSKVLEYCRSLSSESGLDLISLRMKQPEYAESMGYYAVTDAGPAEFLGYLANADLVITDSFHGTVFSFLMGAKNVFTYISDSNKRGVRIINLYDEMGCSDHILHGELQDTYLELQNKSLNKEQINKNIDRIASASRQFLLNSLSNE